MDTSKKYKKGYKVVTKYTLTSAYMIKDSEVKYIMNKWVKPPENGGPLCVFDNINDAYRFIVNRGSAFTMYSCLYELSNEHEVWDKSYIRMSVSDLSGGVRLASKVKLIRMIR